MWCDYAVLSLQENVVCLDRLGRYDVECCCCDFAALECIVEILLNYKRSAAVVDKNYAVLHLRDVVLVDDAFCCREQRAVQEDEI